MRDVGMVETILWCVFIAFTTFFVGEVVQELTYEIFLDVTDALKTAFRVRKVRRKVRKMIRKHNY